MADGVGKINTTGVPNTKEYLLGGGDVMIAELTTSGAPKGFRRVGNCPTFTVTASTETYEHNSTQGATPVQDASVPISSASSIGFVLENMSADNLALFFLGDAESYTNPLKSAGTDVVFIQNADIVKFSWYQIYDANGNAVHGITATNSLVLESSAGTPVAMVEDTDYTVDALSGKIQILDTATIDTIIAAGATDGNIQATWTLDAAATDVDITKGMTQTVKAVAVHIHSKNAMDDEEVTYYKFHKVSLTPDGDLGLITQEAAQLPFSGQVQANAYFDQDFEVIRPLTQA
jgi:hypothetical protein